MNTSQLLTRFDITIQSVVSRGDLAVLTMLVQESGTSILKPIDLLIELAIKNNHPQCAKYLWEQAGEQTGCKGCDGWKHLFTTNIVDRWIQATSTGKLEIDNDDLFTVAKICQLDDGKILEYIDPNPQLFVVLLRECKPCYDYISKIFTWCTGSIFRPSVTVGSKTYDRDRCRTKLSYMTLNPYFNSEFVDLS